MNDYAESMAEEIQMSPGMNVLTGLEAERAACVSRDSCAAKPPVLTAHLAARYAEQFGRREARIGDERVSAPIIA